MSWFREQYRHSLAARGIRTSNLFKKDEMKGALDVFKSNAERYDAGHEISRGVAGRIKGRLMQNMSASEEKGMISIEDDRRFMEDQYAPLEDMFINRRINADQFKSEIDAAYKLFYQHHKKRNSPFGWADKEAEPEPSLYADGEKKNSIWGW